MQSFTVSFSNDPWQVSKQLSNPVSKQINKCEKGIQQEDQRPPFKMVMKELL